jgi:hypothetical protein
MFSGDNLSQFDWASTLPVHTVIVKSRESNVYIYNPQDFGDTGLGTPGLDYQIASVTFLYSYKLEVSVTANADRVEIYSWAIDKTADETSHSGFAGDSFVTNYTVAVDRTAVIEETVSGEIWITNPYPAAVSVTAAVLLDGTVSAEVEYPDGQSIAAYGTLTCIYHASAGASTVTATVAVTGNPDVEGGSSTLPVVPDSSPTVIGYPSVTVTDTSGEFWNASGDISFLFSRNFTTPTDPTVYTGGIYTYQVNNIATIVETSQSDSATVVISAYIPLVSVTTDTSYIRSFTWAIEKGVSSSSHTGFAGDTFAGMYTISVDRTVDDYAFTLSGVISITNPNPSASMPVAAVITSLGAVEPVGSFSILPGQMVTVGYNADLGDGETPPSGVNVATVTLEHATFTAERAYAFGEPTDINGHSTVQVQDSNGVTWMASGDETWNYAWYFTAPTDPAAYTGGVYTYQVNNSATIVETGQSDSASLSITCYAPLVSKTAIAGYTRTYSWQIAKSVDITAHSGFAGESFSSRYDISVDQLVDDYDFAVSGVISITNPNPSSAMPIISVLDSMGIVIGGSAFSVPAGGTVILSYIADLGDGERPPSGTSVAMVTLEHAIFTAEHGYAFGEPTSIVGFGTVTVADSNGSWWTVSGDSTISYSKVFTTPTDPTVYTGGIYTYQVNNTATIVETGQSDSATVVISAYVPLVSVTADTSYTRGYTWAIEKSVSPDSHTGFAGDSFESNYVVFVERTVGDYDFAVSGRVVIYNPNPAQPMFVNVVDMVGGVNAVLDTSNPILIPPGGSVTVGFMAVFGDFRPPDGTSFATVSLPGGMTLEGSASYTFGDPTGFTGPAEVTVTDTDPNSPLSAGVNTTGGSWWYTRTFDCPTDPAQYPGGVYHNVVPNRASIIETGDYADADVELTAYLPLTVTTQPRDAVVTYGQDASFTAATDGVPSPTVQWQVDGVNIPGATDATLTLTRPLVSDSGKKFRAVFTNANGAVYSAEATLTVNRAPLAVTADSRTKLYGEAMVLGTTAFTHTAMFGTDDVTGVTLSSAGAAAGALVSGSPYALVPSAAVGTGLDNYIISYLPGTLIVEPKLLTVTANDRTKTFGEAIVFAGTEFTHSAMFVTDDIASVILSCDRAAAGGPVGTCPIVPSAAEGPGIANYIINYVNGTLKVNPAAVTILYTGDQTVVQGQSFTPRAQLSGPNAGCVNGINICFYLDANPGTGMPGAYILGSVPTNSFGLATFPAINTNGWQPGVYEIEARECCPNVTGVSDYTTLTVGTPGDAASGGGWYTLAGIGRVNFGFSVRQVPDTDPAQYKGNILLINNGKWKLKGTLDTYIIAGTAGSASGQGVLFGWNAALNGGLGDWNVAAENVAFTIAFADFNTTGIKGKDKKAILPDTFGINIVYPVSSGDAPLPNSLPSDLRGGNIDIKTIDKPTPNPGRERE